jgi:hypothetical protein
MEKSNIIVNVVEATALLFLGILLVLGFTHLLNGTLGSWISAKFSSPSASDSEPLKAKSGSFISAGSTGHGGTGEW